MAGRLTRQHLEELRVVVRNLIDLAEAGIARRSDLGDHVWRFELVGDAGESEVHPHFVCDDCGAVSCLPEGAVQVQAVRGAPKALRGGGVEVRVSGLCDTCA